MPFGSPTSFNFFGFVLLYANRLQTVKLPNSSARARRSQRSTDGSFLISVAVDGFSMMNNACRPARFHVRVRRNRYRPQIEYSASLTELLLSNVLRTDKVLIEA